MNILALALAACTPEPAGPGPAPTDPTVPSTAPLTDPDAPWVLPEATAPAPVDLVSLEAAVQDALSRVSRFDADPVLIPYRDLAAGADTTCPAFYLSGDVSYWLDDCTSASGTTFDGFGVDVLQQVDEGGVSVTVETVGGVASVSRGATAIEIDGFVQRTDTDDGTTRSTTLVVTGSFATDHPAAAGSWIEEGVVPDLIVTTYTFGATVDAAIVDGVLQGLPGPFPVVAFDGAILVDPSLGIGDCGLEPAGTVSVLGTEGQWVDIIFDPVLEQDELHTPAGACDGCGRAWSGPEDLGRACFDFTPWLG